MTNNIYYNKYIKYKAKYNNIITSQAGGTGGVPSVGGAGSVRREGRGPLPDETGGGAGSPPTPFRAATVPVLNMGTIEESEAGDSAESSRGTPRGPPAESPRGTPGGPPAESLPSASAFSTPYSSGSGYQSTPQQFSSEQAPSVSASESKRAAITKAKAEIDRGALYSSKYTNDPIKPVDFPEFKDDGIELSNVKFLSLDAKQRLSIVTLINKNIMTTFNIMSTILNEDNIRKFAMKLFEFRNNCIINYSPNIGVLWDGLSPSLPSAKHFTNLHDILITYDALKGIYYFEVALQYVEYLFSFLVKDPRHPTINMEEAAKIVIS